MMSILTLTFKINRVNPFTMVNMSAKFYEEAQNCLVFIVFTCKFPYMSIVTLTFDLRYKRVHPLTTINMSAKFDKEAHNSLVSIVFTRSKCDVRTDRNTAALLYPLGIIKLTKYYNTRVEVFEHAAYLNIYNKSKMLSRRD